MARLPQRAAAEGNSLRLRVLRLVNLTHNFIDRRDEKGGRGGLQQIPRTKALVSDEYFHAFIHPLSMSGARMMYLTAVALTTESSMNG